jgi:hypothetical protein
MCLTVFIGPIRGFNKLNSPISYSSVSSIELKHSVFVNIRVLSFFTFTFLDTFEDTTQDIH